MRADLLVSKEETQGLPDYIGKSHGGDSPKNLVTRRQGGICPSETLRRQPALGSEVERTL